MTLEQLARDKDSAAAMRAFYSHPGFDKIRIAFTNHSPKGDDANHTSVEVAHGQNLGTRYVFNKIEEIVTKPQSEKPKPQTGPGGRDPDLSTP